MPIPDADPSTFRVDAPNVGSFNATLSLTTQRQTTPTQARPVQPLNHVFEQLARVASTS